MLTSVSADIPATRKICGFASHADRMCCLKCFKEFKVTHFGTKPDYSGFSKDSWKARDQVLRHIELGNSANEQNEL